MAKLADLRGAQQNATASPAVGQGPTSQVTAMACGTAHRVPTIVAPAATGRTRSSVRYHPANMARLQIGVEQLGAEGFRLELDGRGGARNVIALAPGGGIRGRYEQDDETVGLHAIRADRLVVSELAWALASGSVGGSARMHEVEIDGLMATSKSRGTRPGFVGRLRAKKIEATADVTLGTTKLHGANLVIDDFELTADESGRRTVQIGGATAATVRGVMGQTQVDITDLVLAAFSDDAGMLHVQRLRLGSVELSVAELSRDGGEPAAPASPGPAASRPRAPLDLGFLDLISGNLAVDVVTDVSLPILGSRKATHSFRLPIDAGVISFKAIEKGIATLESLVLDFEVEGDKLILEKDIPLVPFDNQPLVTWMLDDVGRKLAKDDKVRLSTLARPQLPPKVKAAADADRAKKGKAVELRRIDVDNLDLRISITSTFELAVGEGRVRFGASERASIELLHVTGELAHDGNGDAPRGAIRVMGKGLHAALHGISLPRRKLDAHAVSVDTIEAVDVGFAGFRPRKASVRVAGVQLDKVQLTPR